MEGQLQRVYQHNKPKTDIFIILGLRLKGAKNLPSV
jgi:hypothetical protein